MRTKFYPICFFVCLFFSAKSFSQQYSGSWGTLTERPNTPINEMINGYIEVLPPGYDPNGTTKYPLLIFLEGQSQFGDGGSDELKNLYGLNEGMLPDIIRNNQFPNSYVVGGTTYQFIVLIPQLRRQVQTGRALPDQMASPSEVNDIVNYALQNYRVDEDRIYLSGLSLGGGSTWNYAGESTAYANRLAAIVPFAGASDLDDKPSRADNIANANLPVWTFVNDEDNTYEALAIQYINAINADPDHTTDALITIYDRPVGDHNSWQQPLLGGTTEPPPGEPANLYLWMLSHSRALAQPVFATINAGTDQTLNLADGSMLLGTNSISFTGATINLNGSASAAPGRTITVTQWVRVDGNGGIITTPSSLTTTVTGLKPGSYTYQLRVTDDQGLTTVDNVVITVNAPPENKYRKVEAEAYDRKNPGTPTPLIETSYLDEGPDYGLGFLAPGTWIEYDFTGLTPGTYSLYLRYISPFGNPEVQVTVGTTNYTVNLTSNGDNWTTSNKIDISLGATSTIRFQSMGNQWNFNYFELALVAADAPLPVKFVYFNAHCKNGAVSIQWKTAQEQNSSRFSIQRSTDGTSWTEVGSLTAAGQSTQERSYLFVDKAPSSSAGMYRVVEYDYTGDKTISTIVRSNCSGRTEMSLYPNPSSGNSALNISLERSANITVQVVDAKGSMVQQKQVLLPAGSNTLPLNMTGYPDGVYTNNVHYNGERKALKLIKK